MKYSFILSGLLLTLAACSTAEVDSAETISATAVNVELFRLAAAGRVIDDIRCLPGGRFQIISTRADPDAGSAILLTGRNIAQSSRQLRASGYEQVASHRHGSQLACAVWVDRS